MKTKMGNSTKNNSHLDGSTKAVVDEVDVDSSTKSSLDT